MHRPEAAPERPQPPAQVAAENLQRPGSVTVKDGEFVNFNGGCTWAKS
jgi:hypothetical protein